MAEFASSILPSLEAAAMHSKNGWPMKPFMSCQLDKECQTTKNKTGRCTHLVRHLQPAAQPCHPHIANIRCFAQAWVSMKMTVFAGISKDIVFFKKLMTGPKFVALGILITLLHLEVHDLEL